MVVVAPTQPTPRPATPSPREASTPPLDIVPSATVDEVVTRYPATARVFIRRRMQCVGCEVARFESLAEASRIYGQPLEPLLAELRAAVRRARARRLPGDARGLARESGA